MLKVLWYLLVGWGGEPQTCGNGWHEWSVWSFPALTEGVDPDKTKFLTRKQSRACVECGEVEIRTVEDWCSDDVMAELRKLSPSLVEEDAAKVAAGEA